MKVFIKFLFVILLWSIPIQCDAGPLLSDEEAAGIIRAHFGYPIPVSTQITFKEKSPKMLNYLKSTGYVVDSPAQTCCGDFYATTEKGKPFFGDFVKYLSNSNLYVDCVYAKRAIKSIDTISADTKKRAATVIYIEGLEPNEPVYSAVFRQSQEAVQEIDFNKTRMIKVKLRYDGKGWQVEGKQDLK